MASINPYINFNGTCREALTHYQEVFSAKLLFQHSCHWFCRSQSVASARMVLRHQTTYAQALDGVAPETRRAYLAVVQG